MNGPVCYLYSCILTKIPWQKLDESKKRSFCKGFLGIPIDAKSVQFIVILFFFFHINVISDIAVKSIVYSVIHIYRRFNEGTEWSS